MLRNYLKIAYRNLLKNKVFSLINILGLAIGMTACLLILQYVRFEMSYDDFHENADNIYRVSMDRYVHGEFKFKSAKTYPAIAPRLKEDFPEVVDFIRLMPDHGILADEFRDQRFYEDKIFLADASFFEVFSYQLRKGNPAHVLQAPNTLALSATTARKYFGDEEAVGKTLSFYKDDGTQEIYKVTGVFEDVPPNSHLRFDILMAYNTLQQRYGGNHPDWKPSEDSWEVDEYYTYVLLGNNALPGNLEEKLPDFFTRYKGDLFEARNVQEVLHLQPLRDIHLYSDLQSEIGVTGNFRFVYYLEIVAIFIIFIAWINYVNLTTAKAIERAKEVGIRKVLGSQRSQLVQQFLFESVLVNAMALGAALTLYQLLSPFFQTFSGAALPVTFFEKLISAGMLIGLSLTGIILSSFYPALVLSGFKPMMVLKGKITAQKQGIHLRKGLVIFQFVTAMLMMAGLLTMREQISFMKNQDLGFDTEKMIIVKAAGYLKEGSEQAYESKAVAFKEQLLQYPQIKNITESGFIPGQEIAWRQGLVRRIASEPGAINTYHIFAVDERFFTTYNMEAVAGKVFAEAFTPTDAVIINEAAARQLGFDKAQEAVGEEIYVALDGQDKGRIVGVVKNYHHLSLKNDFQPQIFFYRPATWSYFSVKVAGEHLPEEINILRKEFAAAFPDNPFEYFFLDQFFDAQYKADQRFGDVFGVFTLLSMLIACLGLFGLASYTTVQRTKEIGIRKVLGASVSSILALLSRDFVKLVIMASLIALPLTYFIMQAWLENYAFRIDIGWWLLAAPMGGVILIALLTICFQTIKAALANPVKSLRYE